MTLLLAGLALLMAKGRLNHVLAGLLYVGSGLAVLPPVLLKLREKIGWLRSPWAPVLIITVSLVVVTAITGQPDKPAPQIVKQDPSPPSLLPVPANKRPAINEPIQSAASAYTERVETYWLPAVEALPTHPGTDDDSVGKLLSQIDDMAQNADDGVKLPLDLHQRGMRAKLIAALAAKQVKLLPQLRRRYVAALEAKLFRDDIIVSSSGNAITLEGAPFARNANIEDMETGLDPTVRRLRFRRVVYRWSHYFQDGSHYDLKGPGDGSVALWDGNGYTVIQ